MNTMVLSNTSTNPQRAAHQSIGAMLMDSGKLTPGDAEAILKLQKESGLRFGEAAIKLGLLSESDMKHVLSRQFDYPYLMTGDSAVSDELIAAFSPFSRSVERLRALRSQLMLRFFDVEETTESPHGKALAIVSADRGDGRSYISSNLAVVFSQLGERTLLIDADLRLPRQHEIFKLGNQPGLSSVLSGRIGVNDAIVRIDKFLGLSVLPAGSAPPNPQELLSRPNFIEVLKEAKKNFDIILLDTPAGCGNSDVEIISAKTDGTLILCRQHFSSAVNIQKLAISLAQVGAPMVGTVLNSF